MKNLNKNLVKIIFGISLLINIWLGYDLFAYCQGPIFQGHYVNIYSSSKTECCRFIQAKFQPIIAILLTYFDKIPEPPAPY